MPKISLFSTYRSQKTGAGIVTRQIVHGIRHAGFGPAKQIAQNTHEVNPSTACTLDAATKAMTGRATRDAFLAILPIESIFIPAKELSE